MPIEAPTEGAPPAWLLHVERAHAHAHAAARVIEEEAEPSAHLGPAARAIERGLAAMYDAFDGRSDGISAIGAAHGRLFNAAISLAQAGQGAALARLRGACEELIAAEARWPTTPPAPRAEALLRAGSDRLPLHWIERPSIAPSFRAPPEPEAEARLETEASPRPTTFEELAARAEAVRNAAAERTRALLAPPKALNEGLPAAPAPEAAPPGFAVAPPPRASEGDFIRRWARECFEEIGMLGVQRAPLRGEAFRACQVLERRMITAIDAIAALGPTAIAHMDPLALDAPAADPMRLTAISLIGGCFEGRDALACAERALFRFGPGDPVVAAAFAGAMKLGPNPFISSALRSLLAETAPACRAIAADVMAHRGLFTPDELARLVDEDDPRVFAAALPSFAALRHADLDAALARAMAHPSADVREAALTAMALAAHRDAAATARAEACGDLGDRALVHLAIVGDASDAEWLKGRLEASPSAAAAEAVGWSGLASAAPTLIRLLESADDDALKRAAGEALERMLGAGITELVVIEPEALDDAEPVDPDPEARAPKRLLGELVSDPRDLPPPGSRETIEAASTDPARWRAYWSDSGRRFDAAARWRRGQPYSPSMSLHELDALPLSPVDRRRLHRELAARTGRITHFDPHDFVAVQEDSLRAWGALIHGGGWAPGSWSRPTLR